MARAPRWGWTVRATAVAAVLGLGAGCASGFESLPEEGVLGSALTEAAEASDVPRDLLAALAWSSSRLENRDGEVNKLGEVGVMGLRVEEGAEPSLERAATLVGARPEEIVGDLPTMVLAAAKLLRQMAIEDLGEVPAEIEGWWPVIERWSGQSDARLADGFAREVYRVIEGGFVHRTREGERVELIGREVGALPPPPLTWSTASADYAGAASFTAASSCNYTDDNRGPGEVDYVVIHTVEGSYSGCISWFQNCAASVSAHYVVRSSDGQVTQMVREEDVAWHAGNWDYNLRSIGIEHEGYVSTSAYYTEAMYRESAELVADICDRHGIPKDRAHIIAHSEVPGATHTDPGAYWDWDLFMSLVNGSAPGPIAEPTGDLTGYVREGDIYTGAAVAGASVGLSNGWTTTVDAAGMYTFHDLPPGSYTVTASASGYETASATKEVVADLLNWKSIALTASGGGADGGDGGGDPAPAPSGAPGAPVSLTPDGVAVWDAAVTLQWTDTGAASVFHEVEIWYWNGSDWSYYWTYTPAPPRKTFWPAVRGTWYTFAVRGHNTSGWGAWSGWAEFEAP